MQRCIFDDDGLEAVELDDGDRTGGSMLTLSTPININFDTLVDDTTFEEPGEGEEQVKEGGEEGGDTEGARAREGEGEDPPSKQSGGAEALAPEVDSGPPPAGDGIPSDSAGTVQTDPAVPEVHEGLQWTPLWEHFPGIGTPPLDDGTPLVLVDDGEGSDSSAVAAGEEAEDLSGKAEWTDPYEPLPGVYDDAGGGGEEDEEREEGEDREQGEEEEGEGKPPASVPFDYSKYPPEWMDTRLRLKEGEEEVEHWNDEVQAFSLDPEFNYDTIKLTPKPRTL